MQELRILLAFLATACLPHDIINTINNLCYYACPRHFSRIIIILKV